jgi:hypothetical protein
MFKKYFFLMIVLSIAAVLPAATVSFLVIETGLPMEAAANEHSGLWESGLLDVFFEAGHIVSNAPILRLDKKPVKPFPEEFEDEFNEAAAGGAEYFILAELDYAVKADGSAGKPENVLLKVFNADTAKLVYEKNYTDKSSRNAKDEFNNVKKAVRGLVPRIGK